MDMKMATRTQVAIIGGGPAGLLLSHILHRNGVDSIVLERQSRTHVLGRIRAGVLEAGTVELLREVGLGARMDREGYPHNGSAIAWEGRPRFFIDTKKFTGKEMMAYGSQGVGIATLIFRYFLRYFSSTHRTDLSRFRGPFYSFDPVGFAIFAIPSGCGFRRSRRNKGCAVCEPRPTPT